MNLFKYKLIYNSTQQQGLWLIFKRFKSKKGMPSTMRALNHFDDFYGAIFGEKWPSVRLGLLSRQKSFALINNLGEVERTEKLLGNLGAFDLRSFFDAQKNYVEESNTGSVSNNNKTGLDKLVSGRVQKEEKCESELLYPEGMDVNMKVKDFHEKNEKSEYLEETIYNLNEATNSLASDMNKAEIDSCRQIMPGSSTELLNLDFIPATKLRGVENFIPESEYYKYYKVQSDRSVMVEEEFELDFPENLKVFTFDRGEVRDFPEPIKCINGVYNYLKLDGADLLVALALNVQPGDRVLDMCSTSENIAYCLFQTLRAKLLICTNDKKYKTLDLFNEYLYNNSASPWADMLFVTSSSFNEIEDDMMFDKVLVEAPSTFDKTSLFEEEDNIFHPLSSRNRIELPTLQCSLLIKGLKLVKPGGTVIYTTSTLSPIQNDGVVLEAIQTVWTENKMKCTVKNLFPALRHTSLLFNYGDYLNLKFGTLVVPFLPSNFGPKYICKIVKNEQKEEGSPLGEVNVEKMVTSEIPYETELEGEFAPISPYPIPVDIDDGIARDITLSQEIFGVVNQYGTNFEVMRFTLNNTLKDGIKLQVMSLGAALVGVFAPDRKGEYKDVVLGFDCVHYYYSPLNPGFGRITSLCPLPYNLEKVVWDWDFDRDEASVTFSTNFYRIDLILCVKYTLNVCNEIIVDIKASGSKIVPISLTSQVYWNMAGHYKGEAALKHHALSINSDRIWKHLNHKLKNFLAVHDTVLDFRQPTLMDNDEIFGDKKFEHVYVVSKGCKQTVSFVARLIHPRTCRYVEIFSDQPWILCNTLNKFPRRDWDLEPCPSEELNDYYGECSEDTSEVDPCDADDERARLEELMKELDEIPGKEGQTYRKYGGFCVTPLSDLTGYDPILRAGTFYSHRIIYKLGIYRRYMKRSKKREECEEEGEQDEERGSGDDIVDLNRE